MVFGSKPYDDYLSYPLFGGPLRAVFFVIGLMGIIGFLSLVPREHLFYEVGQKHSAGLSFTGDLHQGLAGISDHRLEPVGIRLCDVGVSQCFTDDLAS